MALGKIVLEWKGSDSRGYFVEATISKVKGRGHVYNRRKVMRINGTKALAKLVLDYAEDIFAPYGSP